MTTTSTKMVRYRDVLGRLGEIELTDRSEFVSPGSALEQRLVVANEQLFLCKYVSRAAGSRDPRRYDLLDNEIRAGARLAQVFTGGGYPPELARLVAYNLDVEEPFALLRGYTGEPAAGLAHRFDEAQRRQFQIGLLRAMQLIGAAGIVHGAVSLDALRWDGRQLQLVDFESAQRVGDPRRGSGEVDVRDDMWATGLLIRGLHVGGLTGDRSTDPELLRALLDPIFDNPVEHRPHPVDLLRRLRVDSRLPPMTDPEAVLQPGRQLFEQISAGKRGPAPPDPPTVRIALPARRSRLAIPFLTTMIIVAVLIIGMAVLI